MALGYMEHAAVRVVISYQVAEQQLRPVATSLDPHCLAVPRIIFSALHCICPRQWLVSWVAVYTAWGAWQRWGVICLGWMRVVVVLLPTQTQSHPSSANAVLEPFSSPPASLL